MFLFDSSSIAAVEALGADWLHLLDEMNEALIV